MLTPTVDEGYKQNNNGSMRRPRFKRVPPKNKGRLTPQQLDILELVYQFKALRSHHIAMHTGRSQIKLDETLRIMFDRALLDKVSDVRRFNALYQHDVYRITKKGQEALATRGIPHQFIPTDTELGFTMNKDWDHNMMIIDLLSNLYAGAKANGVRMLAPSEMAENATVPQPFLLPRKTTYVNKERKVVPYIVKPDGAVGFEYPDKRRAHFVVEAEHNKANTRRRNSTGSSTNTKFLQYSDVDWKTVYKNLGIKGMQVLVTAPTAKRIENKFTDGAKVVPPNNIFRGHWMPVVSTKDVPLLPNIFDATWLRIGLEPEYINALLS